MRAKDVPRDISSRKQDVPAPGDGAASEWLRSYLQESIRPPVWPYGQHTGNPSPANAPDTAWSDNPGARPPGPYHLGRWPRRGGIQFHRTLSFFGTGHTKILSFQSPENASIPLSNFMAHSLGTADYSYFQAIFDQIDLYGGNTTLYFLHAPRITPVFLRRFGCEFR